jgi:hypothetical protein
MPSYDRAWISRLTLQAIRRNIPPSIGLIHPELCWIPDLPERQAGFTLPIPTIQILKREQQSTWLDSQSAQYSTGTAKSEINDICRLATQH